MAEALGTTTPRSASARAAVLAARCVDTIPPWAGCREATPAEAACQCQIGLKRPARGRARHHMWGLRQFAPERRHAQHGLGGVAALVALAAARARERLVHVLDGQHAERARHAGAQLDVLDAARGLGADVVVVVGLAADAAAQAGDAVVAAGLRRVERRERQLEGPGAPEGVVLGPRLAEGLRGPALEPLGQLGVEPADG